MTVAAVAAAAAVTPAAYGAPTNSGWPTGGQNLDNSRYQAADSAISTASASTLAPRGALGMGGAFVTGGGDVSATPAVDGQRVYFPASNGKLFAIDRTTGATIWTASIPDLTGIKTANGATGNDYARATPAIAGQVLVIGTQSGKFQTPDFAAARPDLAGTYVLDRQDDRRTAVEDEGRHALRGDRDPVRAGQREHRLRRLGFQRGGLRQPGSVGRHPLHVLHVPREVRRARPEDRPDQVGDLHGA